MKQNKKYFLYTPIVLFLFLLLVITWSCGIDEEKAKGGTNGMYAFVSVGSWRGTNGEVIQSIYADDQTVYASAGEDGLILFQADTLAYKGIYTNQPVESLAIKKIGERTLAFTAVGYSRERGGVVVLDVTDPTNIGTAAEYLSEKLAGRNILLDGNSRIYLSDKNTGFHIFEYDANQKKIMLIQTPDVNYSGVNLAVCPKYLYIASKDRGLHIVNKNNGKPLGKILHALSMVNAVVCSSNRVIVSDKMEGIQFYNIDDPANPRFITSYETSGDAFDLSVDGNEISVADGISGVLKFRINPNGTFAMLKYFRDGTIASRLFYYKPQKKLYVTLGKDGFMVLE